MNRLARAASVAACVGLLAATVPASAQTSAPTTTAAGTGSTAARPSGGGGGGGTITLGGDGKALTMTVGGATLEQQPDGKWTGVVTGTEVTVSGSWTFAMANEGKTYLRVDVGISGGGKSEAYHWPPEAGARTMYGPVTAGGSFSLKVPITGGTRTVAVSGNNLNCGDWVCGPMAAEVLLRGPKDYCDEAFRLFETPWNRPLATDIRFDYDDLLGAFRSGIERWKSEHRDDGQELTVSDPADFEEGTIEAGAWLFSDDPTKPPLPGWSSVGAALRKKFSFSRNLAESDRENIQAWAKLNFAPNITLAKTTRITRGSEADLARSIAELSRAEKRHLTPGDVLYLAIQRTGGDARRALLLAHNTLKGMARGGALLENGLPRNDAFFREFLQPLRIGDSSGAWYHLFGTAFFNVTTAKAISTTGKVAGVGAVGTSAVLYTPAFIVGEGAAFFGYEGLRRLRQMMEATMRGAVDPEGMGYSDFANMAEQAFRELGGRAPDPGKFCFNVWGQKLGHELYTALTGDGSIPLPDLAPPNPYGASKWPMPTPEEMLAEAKKALAATTRPGETTLPVGEGVYYQVGSPVDLLIEVGGRQVLLLQDSGSVLGDLGFPVIPLRASDGTWGVGWVQPADREAKVTAIGVRDGEVHVAALRGADGGLSVWTADVAKGDQLSLAVPASSSTDAVLTRDGATVDPVRARVTPDPSPGPRRALVIGGFAVLVMLTAVLVRRARRSAGTA